MVTNQVQRTGRATNLGMVEGENNTYAPIETSINQNGRVLSSGQSPGVSIDKVKNASRMTNKL